MKSNAITLFLILIFTRQLFAACPAGSIQGNTPTDCYFVYSSPLNWVTAEESCTNGGHLRHSLCKNHPLVQGSRVKGQGFFLCPIKSIGYWSLITESREKNSETSPLWSWGVGRSKNRFFRIDSDSHKTDTNRFLDPDLNTKVPKTTVGDLRNPYLD